MNNLSTLTKIIELCRLMVEGDRVRVLKFCESISESRQQKKAQRRRRFVQNDAIDSWKIGS